MPRYALLGHLRVDLRVTLSTNTHIVFNVAKESSFQYDKDLCPMKLCGLQDLQPAVLSQRCNLRSEVYSMQSVIGL